jgi:hypothetical protein
MKKQLRYSKNAVIKDFVTNMDYGNNAHLNAQNPFNNNFAPDNRPLNQQTIDSINNQVDYLFCRSNNCRGNYTPIFADQTQFHERITPTSTTIDNGIGCGCGCGSGSTPPKPQITPIQLGLPVQNSLPNVADLTEPPTKKDDTLVKSILIGAGVLILLNLLK